WCVDGAVGPAIEQGADEAFCFAVRLRSVSARAAVTDAAAAARGGVDGGDGGTAVVGEDPLDADAMPSEEGERAPQEADRGRSLLVGEHFRVGEAAVVVDCDVDVFPADGEVASPGGVDDSPVGVAADAADPFAGAVLDPTQPLDVDVDELARPQLLVADRLLEPDPAELAHPGAGEDRRHGR